MPSFPANETDKILLQSARFNEVAKAIEEEVHSGKSSHWDMPWGQYVIERASDMDLAEAYEDMNVGTWTWDEVVAQAEASILRRLSGLGRKHAANRRK
jgi:hypothetical protein